MISGYFIFTHSRSQSQQNNSKHLKEIDTWLAVLTIGTAPYQVADLHKDALDATCWDAAYNASTTTLVKIIKLQCQVIKRQHTEHILDDQLPGHLKTHSPTYSKSHSEHSTPSNGSNTSNDDNNSPESGPAGASHQIQPKPHLITRAMATPVLAKNSGGPQISTCPLTVYVPIPYGIRKTWLIFIDNWDLRILLTTFHAYFLFYLFIFSFWGDQCIIFWCSTYLRLICICHFPGSVQNECSGAQRSRSGRLSGGLPRLVVRWFTLMCC